MSEGAEPNFLCLTIQTISASGRCENSKGKINPFRFCFSRDGHPVRLLIEETLQSPAMTQISFSEEGQEIYGKAR
jgi:hypothetical protein